MICADFGGKVPDTMEDLIKLPGVARKTANIVLSSGYKKAEGIAVDTHVKRLSERLGLSTQTTRKKLRKTFWLLCRRRTGLTLITCW